MACVEAAGVANILVPALADIGAVAQIGRVALQQLLARITDSLRQRMLKRCELQRQRACLGANAREESPQPDG
jgi:hypothetical protein